MDVIMTREHVGRAVLPGGLRFVTSASHSPKSWS